MNALPKARTHMHTREAHTCTYTNAYIYTQRHIHTHKHTQAQKHTHATLNVDTASNHLITFLTPSLPVNILVPHHRRRISAVRGCEAPQRSPDALSSRTPRSSTQIDHPFLRLPLPASASLLSFFSQRWPQRARGE